MKHLIILLIPALLLTGCSAVSESDTENVGFQTTETTSYVDSNPDISEPISEVTSALTTGVSVSSESAATATTAQTDTAPSMSIETAEPDVVSTTAATSSTVATATTPTATTTPQPIPQTTTITTTIATPAAPETSETVSEETEPPVEVNQYDLPVFIEYKYGTPVTTFDGAPREYLLVTVVPEKIYWNDEKRFDAKEGEPLNILIPAVMYDTMKNADSTVLHFNSYNSFPNEEETLCFYPKSDGDNDLTYDNVITGKLWDIDNMFIIKDGFLTEFEYTEEMLKFLMGFNFDYSYSIDSSVMLDYYPDRFYYGMTIDEFDTFFDNTHRKIVEMEEYAEEVRKELNDDSYNVGCDLVSYSFFLEGTEMRVRLK